MCNSPELREAHNEMLPSVTAFQAKITLDPELWRAIKICVQNSEELDLDPIDRRLMDEIVKDFEESGANLSDEKRREIGRNFK